MHRRLVRVAILTLVAILVLASTAVGFAAPGRPERARAAARAHLKANSAALKIKGDLADLRDAGVVESLGAAHVHFQQMVGDVPVEGGVLNVGLDDADNVLLVTGEYKANLPALATRPSLPAAAAVAAARQAVGAPQAQAAATALAVYAEGPVALAWKVTLGSDEPLGSWDVFVDAASGQVLAARSTLRQADGQGKIFNPNPVVTLQNTSLRDQNNADYAALATAYSTVTLPRLDGSGYLKGSYVSVSAKLKKDTALSATLSFLYGRSDLRFEQVMAYYHIDRTQAYIQSLGFANVDNRQQAVTSNGTTADNSFYSPSSKAITYGTGGVDDAEDADVIIHEYGHSVQDNQVPGFGSSAQAGAMGEGFGDYLAFSMTAGATGQTGSYLACVAEWDATSYDTRNPPCLRRLDGNKVYPTNFVNEVHADGEIWSRALYDIWTTYGKTVADTLVIRSHFFLTPGASFSNGANAIIAADNALYGGSHVSSLRGIFAARGIATA